MQLTSARDLQGLLHQNTAAMYKSEYKGQQPLTFPFALKNQYRILQQNKHFYVY